MLRIIILIAAMCAAQSAIAQTFEFSAQTFRANFDSQLRSDGGDVTKACVAGKDGIVCKFDDAAFQKSVKAFKKLNLANGRFALDETMIITSEGGKVDRILIKGNRADPMGLFHFIGQVGSLIIALDPSINSKRSAEIMKDELGLLRGDDSDTIGEPQLAILDKFAIRCNSQRSRISMAIGCAVEPRS